MFKIKKFFTLLIFKYVNLFKVNMSPNLSSAHYSQNRLIYEQVLFNLFAIVGLTHFKRLVGIFFYLTYVLIHYITYLRQ